MSRKISSKAAKLVTIVGSGSSGSRELEHARVNLAAILDLSATHPSARASRRASWEGIAEPKYTSMDFSLEEISHIVEALGQITKTTNDAGPMFWVLGKSPQRLGFPVILDVLRERIDDLSERELSSAITGLETILWRRAPGPKKILSFDSCFLAQVAEWLTSETEAIRQPARRLAETLIQKWGIDPAYLYSE